MIVPANNSVSAPPFGRTVMISEPKSFDDHKAMAAMLTEWCRYLFAPDQVVELRALQVRHGIGIPHTECGYFDGEHRLELAKTALQVTKNAQGVYATLNPVDPTLLARRKNRIDWAKSGDATKDKEIIRRRWLLVDIDPDRPSGISATDSEKACAFGLVNAVRDDLRARGWPEPILADSGNGYHLFYRIDLSTRDGDLVKRVLEVLAERFDNPQAKVDKSVHNPARIVKLPGTLSRKGDPTEDRPHRWSRLLEVPVNSNPYEVAVVTREQLEAIVKEQSVATNRSTSGSTTISNTSGNASHLPRLLVEKWLNDHGVVFRVKEADADGWTKYILKTCPFNTDHLDPDACIMQHSSGKLAARCLHNGCAGKQWKEFKNQIGVPEGHHFLPADPTSLATRPGPSTSSTLSPTTSTNEVSPTGEPELPRILCNQRQLADVTREAERAVVEANSPPSVFTFSSVLCRLRPSTVDGPPQIEPLTESAMRGVLARTAIWKQTRVTKKGPIEVDCPPPMDVVKDWASRPEYPELPVLESVVSSPVFDRHGQLVFQPGYHPGARAWYWPARGLTVPTVSTSPTDTELDNARRLIRDELLGDFPFVDKASHCHAVACMLLPLIRRLIDGPTPLHLFDAPTEGTGKTLLATVISLVATGQFIEGVPEPGSDEEWRKQITSLLIGDNPMILFDNLNQHLGAGPFANVLTSRIWMDRILGVSKMTTIPNLSTWLATGNNVSLSKELLRRTVWCRLDSRTEFPNERTGFRHPNLLEWVRKNRGDLLHALLTLCQAWIVRGRPLGHRTLGGFESWSHIVGGILNNCGMPDLLANAHEFRSKSDRTGSSWDEFIAEWWRTFGDQQVGVDKLFEIARKTHLLDMDSSKGHEQSQRTKIGNALRNAVDRVFGQFRLELCAKDKSKRSLYRLVCLDSKAHNTGVELLK